MITVRELIAELQLIDPDRVVVCQSDSEGNGYSPLAGADGKSAYLADTTYSGEAYHEDAEDEEDLPPSDAVPCVVLYPVD